MGDARRPHVAVAHPVVTRAFGLTLALLASLGAARAQGTTPQRGFQPANSYAVSDIETINTTNGNLMLRLPLGGLPAGRGGMSAGISLNYDSKLYDSYRQYHVDYSRVNPATGEHGLPVARELIGESLDGGWHYGTGYRLEVLNRLDQYPFEHEPKYPDPDAKYIFKVRMSFPDGSTHEFVPRGYNAHQKTPPDGYYDLRPDGWRAVWAGGGCSPQTPCVTVDIVPFTANTITYYSADGTYLRLDVEHDSDDLWWNNPWTLYLPDGGRVTGGNSPQRIYDRNDNFVELRNITYNGHQATQLIDQLGRDVILEYGYAADEDAVHVKGYDGETLTYRVKWKTLDVNKTYATSYDDGDLGHGYPDTIGSISAVAEVILPQQAGGLKYVFAYNAADAGGSAPPNSGWGEVRAVTLPSGAQSQYQYYLDGRNHSGSDFIAWQTVIGDFATRKDLTYLREYDGSSTSVTETWLYDLAAGTITGPDGGVTRELLDDYRRAHRTEHPDGTLTERIWRENVPQDHIVVYTPQDFRGTNNYVKTEFTSVRDAAGNLTRTAIKDYGYDKNGNVWRVAEYDWVGYGSVPRDGAGKPTGIPAGLSPKRVITTDYYNATPDASDTTSNDPDSYFNAGSPRLRRAVASVEVSDGSQPVSRTESTYDDAATRGNLTGQKSWDSTKGAYSNPLTASNSISVSRQYDGYGNPTLSTDARGVQTKFAYGPVGGHTDLYPTETRAAENYPSLRRTTQTQYDFSTGLATRVTDADNDVSAATVYDVFGRPTLSCAADNVPAARACTATEYSDPLRRAIARKDRDGAQDGKLVSVVHYDQLGRVRLSRQLEDSSAQSPYEETHGVKVQTRYAYSGPNSYQLVSNPYRAGYSHQAGGEPTMGWSRVKSDQGGRAVEARTFGGASLPAPWGSNTSSSSTVTTAYDAEFTTVTDHGGGARPDVVRRSVTNGLGLLARVDEPDGNGNLGLFSSPAQPTYYTYDALGNLTQVQQGAQARAFAYSSLSRLTSATNPESGTVSYTYDANGNLKTKTDARQITITYDYDELNRSITADYSDTPSINPDVSRIYDNPAAGAYGKGRFWYDYAGGNHAAGQTVEHAAVDSYDALGRPVVRRQLFKTGGAWGAPYQTSRQYDRAGAVVSQTYPSGRTVSYSYDAAGRVASFAGNLGDGAQRTYADQITYDGAGRMREERFGTATPLYHKLNYNARGQLYDVRLSTAGGAQGEWNWDRGRLTFYYGSPLAPHGQAGAANNGNVARVEHWVPMDPNVAYGTGGQGPWAIYYQDYQYDALNRLRSATERKVASGGAPEVTNFVQAYDYDRWGNRQIDAALTTGGAGETQFEMGQAASNNRLLAPGDLARPEGERLMRYDASGNLTHDGYTGGGGRTYDAENRMTGAWGPGALPGTAFESRYGYDADGRRVRRLTPGENVWQVYGIDGELLAEYAANGSPSAPKKEYGYRAGELLVVAEAAGATSPAPAALVAAPGGTVTLSWGAAAGAAKYRVERSADGAWASPAVYSTAGAETTYPDGTASQGAAYLYRVCAADSANNCVSAYSNAALGAARSFTDPQIVTYADHQQGLNLTLPLTTIKAAHVVQLREAVDAVRQLAGLAPADWGETNLQGLPVRADHVRALRTKLGEALSALGLPAPSYETLSEGVTVIKRDHFAELRLAATRGAGAGSAGAGGTTGGVKWLVADHLGTPRMTADQTGSLQGIRRHDYFPFGEEIGDGVGGRTTGQGYSQADNVRQQFTGYERDNEIGLDFAQARYYSSSQGRFTSVDPSRKSIMEANPQTWNRYIYALNNPHAFVDRNGKWPTRIHKLIIDSSFPGLGTRAREAMKQGSWNVDNWRTGGQDTGRANEHGMTKPGQPQSEAAQHANEFIEENVGEARKERDRNMMWNAFLRFGQAFHTVSDMTSPMHEGYQVWRLRDAVSHRLGEELMDNYRLGLAVGATQKLYAYTFGQEALQNATGGIQFGSNDDPNIKTIQAYYALPGSSIALEAEAIHRYRMGLNAGYNFDWKDQKGKRNKD